jgi:coenzyme PQQ synthesis protein D (PqqD)
MTSYRLAPDLLRAPLGDEEVLFNVKSGQYHLITRTGLTLVSALEAGRSLEDAAHALATDTGASFDAVLADGRVFVGDLLERGLLEISR